LVLQLFSVVILKMLQYFLKCWTTFFYKIQHFYSFFVNIFVKCCINFGTTFLPTCFEKHVGGGDRASARGAVASGLRPAPNGRQARAELQRCPASTARQPCELPWCHSPLAMAARKAREELRQNF
jgi:hypothetical protein